LPWSGTSRVVLLTDELLDDAAPMTYFLEVSIAKEVIEVLREWRGGGALTEDDRLAAVVHYAKHDAYLPV
jgi:hypothetical protein